MTTDLRAHLDRLDTALAAATPGPWFAWNRGVGWHLAVEDPAGVDHLPGRPHLVPEGTRTDLGRAEDAALIVAAVNALPRLLAAVRAAADLAVELDGEATAYAQEADGLPRGSSKRDALLGRLLGKKAAAIRLRTALAAALTEGVAR